MSVKIKFLAGLGAFCICAFSIFAGENQFEKVDNSSLKGKFMCGYQGWFRTPKDGANMGWNHYSRLRDTVDKDSLVVDMLPDVAELSAADKVELPNIKYADGSPVYAMSSHNKNVIDLHFKWMALYDIDGAWYQHFLIGFEGGLDGAGYMSRRQNMLMVKDAAEKYGRVWAVCFDTAMQKTETIAEKVIEEWKRLIDEKIAAGPSYLKENGLPVVHIWGFYHKNNVNFMSPEEGQKLIDFFNADTKYKATLVGGGDWNWQENKDPAWQKMFARLKFYTPWNVGNKRNLPDGTMGASMGFWKGDKAQAEAKGTFWIPVVYPGFSWDNMKKLKPGTSNIPRKKGDFLWEQFHEANKLGADTFYIAMFDEIDEGTAVFKLNANPPEGAHFLGTEGMPADWYLRLIKEARSLIKQGKAIPREIPVKP